MWGFYFQFYKTLSILYEELIYKNPIIQGNDYSEWFTSSKNYKLKKNPRNTQTWISPTCQSPNSVKVCASQVYFATPEILMLMLKPKSFYTATRHTTILGSHIWAKCCQSSSVHMKNSLIAELHKMLYQFFPYPVHTPIKLLRFMILLPEVPWVCVFFSVLKLVTHLPIQNKWKRFFFLLEFPFRGYTDEIRHLRNRS